MIAILVGGILILAYANGANDNFKSVATLYGSNTLRYRAALALATVGQIAGSVAALFIAAALIRAFGGKGLVPGATLAHPSFLVVVSVAAAATVLIATRAGMPISTTHAIVGSLVGAGIALAPGELAWGRLTEVFLAPLLITPVVAIVVAACLYPPLHFLRRRLGLQSQSYICVGGRWQSTSTPASSNALLMESHMELGVCESGECCDRYDGTVLGISAQGVLDKLHMISAFALAFARGVNDTPKILGILLAASIAGFNIDSSLPLLIAAVLTVATVMALGGMLHSRRLAETLGRRITSMNHGQGFLANIVAATLVIAASVFGFGVSTTHCTTGAIFGLGIWTKRADVRTISQIALAWIVTLPLAAFIAVGLAQVM